MDIVIIDAETPSHGLRSVARSVTQKDSPAVLITLKDTPLSDIRILADGKRVMLVQPQVPGWT